LVTGKPVEEGKKKCKRGPVGRDWGQPTACTICQEERDREGGKGANGRKIGGKESPKAVKKNKVGEKSMKGRPVCWEVDQKNPKRMGLDGYKKP